jgi:uroporphyrinogen decarboxylase
LRCGPRAAPGERRADEPARSKERSVPRLMNGREKALRDFRHEKYERFPRSRDLHSTVFPGDWSGPWSKDADKRTDWFGVHWTPVPAMGQMVTETGDHIIKDLENWRNEAVIPYRELENYDWAAGAGQQMAAWDRDNQMSAVVVLSGLFERLHSLMGFEEALMAFYLNPEEMRSFYEELSEYKILCLRKIKEYYKPDIVIYHDDWGTQLNTFFDPEQWRQYIKPYTKKIIDECHRLGMYFEMHSCGHIFPLLGDLVEMGIDSIQTLQYPQNDIKAVKELYGDRLVTRGGYDGQKILVTGVSDDEIRKTVRYSIETLAPGGFHIPYVFFFGSGFEHAMAIMEETVAEFEKEFF